MADWDAIKAEYIAGGVTYKELSSKYGIPEKTIRNTASRKNWTKDRDKVGTHVGQALLTRAREAREGQLDDLITASTTWTSALRAVVESMSKEPALIMGDLNGARAISNSLATMTDVLYKLNRIKTPMEEAKIKIDEARLKWEKEKWKAEMEQRTADESTKYIWKLEEDTEGVDLDGA